MTFFVCFLCLWGEKRFNTTISRSSPFKCCFAGFAALWLIRTSGPVLLRNPIFLRLFRGGVWTHACVSYAVRNISFRLFSYFVWMFIWWPTNKWASAWDFQQWGMCDQQSLRSACAYAQSDQSLCSSLEYSMSVKLLTKHLLEVLSLRGGCRGSFEPTLVKMPYCWKSRVAA